MKLLEYSDHSTTEESRRAELQEDGWNKDKSQKDQRIYFSIYKDFQPYCSALNWDLSSETEEIKKKSCQWNVKENLTF